MWLHLVERYPDECGRVVAVAPVETQVHGSPVGNDVVEIGEFRPPTFREPLLITATPPDVQEVPLRLPGRELPVAASHFGDVDERLVALCARVGAPDGFFDV